ncbi:TPA: hypothetical protein ACH3X3_010344 [Trebouxia sp. C0006]
MASNVTSKDGDLTETIPLIEGRLHIPTVQNAFTLRVVKIDGALAPVDSQGFTYAIFKPGDTLNISGTPAEVAAMPGGHQVPVDKTARKITQLAQLVGGLPPSFQDLEAFLFEHGGVKLPVLDAKYYSLITANEALMAQIEPASLSGAEALAEIVTAALRMQYEPVQDEAMWIRFCGMSGSAWTRTTKDPSLVCSARETVLKILQQSRARGRTSAFSAPRRCCSKEKIRHLKRGLRKQ